MLEKEFTYYKEMQDNFVEEYNDKYIVIKGTQILGAYDSELEAYLSTAEEHEVGTFLIQHVLPGEESYTIKFHSRVS